jgi:rSAM/selenodomain-associated transferase 1
MTPTNHLVAFVRAPRLGRVKTRLAADIGAVAAWAFYRRTARAVLHRLGGHGRWRPWLAVTPLDAAAPGVWPDTWRRIGQGTGDLGERMGRVMRALPPGPAVIIGTDVPDIRPDHVARAFRALGRHDAVFGPAADGGYWLVGLRRRPRVPEIFEGVRWSTEFALADTLANALTLDVALLDVLDDVDDGAALERWRRREARGYL